MRLRDRRYGMLPGEREGNSGPGPRKGFQIENLFSQVKRPTLLRSRPLHTGQMASRAERYTCLQTLHPASRRQRFLLASAPVLFVRAPDGRDRHLRHQGRLPHGFSANRFAVADMRIRQNNRSAEVAFAQHQPDKPQPVSVASENKLPANSV